MKLKSIDFLIEAQELFNKNNLIAAKNKLRRLIKNDASNIDALRFLGIISAIEKNYTEALHYFDAAINIFPKNPLVISNKANVFQELNNYDNAINLYIESLTIDPNQYETWSNLGNAYFEKNKYDDAIRCHLKSVTINPLYYQGWSNLGNTYCQLKQYDDAIKCHQKAININPRYYQSWSNLGYVYKLIKNNYESIKAYENALLIKKDYPEAHLNISIALLERGDFINGWKHYQHRWESSNFDTKYIKTNKSIWTGQEDKKPLCIWAEQGIGDQILFGRFLSDFKDKELKIYVAINKKLVVIFQRSFPKLNFIPYEKLNDINYQYHLPIGNLPSLFLNQYEDFKKSNSQYLLSNKVLNNEFSQRLCKLGSKKLKCGLSIKSINKKYIDHKSLNIDNLEHLILNKFQYINLDYYESNDLKNVQNKYDIYNFQHLDLFNDLDSVLSLIDACDFVVTVSNTVAHLAGALGKNTYLLVPYSIGRFWYWNHQTEDQRSLWYPSVKIFSQQKCGDWGKPINDLNNYLEKNYYVN